MGKTGTNTKKKEKSDTKFVTMDIDLDTKTIKVLEGIAKLAALTVSEVVSVYLATIVWNDKQEKKSAKVSKKKNPGISLGD